MFYYKKNCWNSLCNLRCCCGCRCGSLCGSLSDLQPTDGSLSTNVFSSPAAPPPFVPSFPAPYCPHSCPVTTSWAELLIFFLLLSQSRLVGTGPETTASQGPSQASPLQFHILVPRFRYTSQPLGSSSFCLVSNSAPRATKSEMKTTGLASAVAAAGATCALVGVPTAFADDFLNVHVADAFCELGRPLPFSSFFFQLVFFAVFAFQE